MSNNYQESGIPGDKELLFLSLGGIGTIGANLYIYGHKGKWLVVDFGIGFAGDNIPGVDIILPDISFLEQNKDDIVGIVITHAHEDHIGAFSYIFDKVNVPIYATAFTADMVRHKLNDGGFSCNQINVIATGAKFSVDVFDLEYIEMTHSIPEPQSLLIKTNVGNVLHTGDWKVDKLPVVGHNMNYDRLKQIGTDGVLALVGDSTNVMSGGVAESEGDVRGAIYNTIKSLDGGVVITCFASNVARLSSIIEAGVKCNRKIVLAGRSLFRVTECAIKNGYLTDVPEFYEADEVREYNKSELLYICTGSQGESRATLARIARREHRHIKLSNDDTVIFSARTIPGNEATISNIQNMLIQQGAHIITAKDAPVHASGHCARAEMIEMYDLIKPQVAIPMHGEALHLSRHSQLAQDCGVEKTYVLNNGDVVVFDSDGCALIDTVYTGEMILDGDKITPVDSSAVRQRRKMSFGGLIVASVVIDEVGTILNPPQITLEGIAMSCEVEREQLVELITDNINNLSDKDVCNDNKVKEATRIATRRYVEAKTGKKSVVKIHLSRVSI